MKSGIKIICCCAFSIAVLFFVLYGYKYISKTWEDIYKIIAQSMLSGLTTFLGLFFTFKFQIKQNEEVNREARCPSFAIKQEGRIGVSFDYRNTRDEQGWSCMNDSDVMARKVACSLINVKKAYALNVQICNNLVGVVEAEAYHKGTLVLSDDKKEGEIKIIFEDAYGITYLQIITYVRNNTNYIFCSGIPKKYIG